MELIRSLRMAAHESIIDCYLTKKKAYNFFYVSGTAIDIVSSFRLTEKKKLEALRCVPNYHKSIVPQLKFSLVIVCT